MQSNHRVVLWAEDDENDALLLRRALEKAKLSEAVVRVPDGEEAIRYLAGVGCYGNRESYPFPSALLLDVKMPRKNGFEVLTWKQSHPELRDLRAVMLSSSDVDGDRQAAYQLGANGYFVKPSLLNEMVGIVQSLLETAKAA